MLVRELVRRQIAAGEHDGQMAARLGISRPLWQMIRTGSVRPTVRLLGAVLRAYPDLRNMALAEVVARVKEIEGIEA